MDALISYLTSRIPDYTAEDAEYAIAGCDQIYTREDGVLGIRAKGKGILEILFLVADSPKTRRELIRQGAEEHDPELICYHRPKYMDKPYIHGKAFWRKLCHG